MTILFDAGLTFVPPALAFTTTSARRSIVLGTRMLRQEWPHCAWHALTPPLALTLLLQLGLGPVVPSAVLVVLVVASLVVQLWFKGAIVAYYLRVSPGPSRAF